MCHIWHRAAVKDTGLSRGKAAPRYPHRSLKHLCCLMSALPGGVYWWLPLIPPSLERNMWGNDPTAVKVCVRPRVAAECVCWRTHRFVRPFSHPGRHSHTGLAKHVPVAKQLCHTRSRPISTLSLEEGGPRSLEIYPSWRKLIDNSYPASTVIHRLLKIARFSRKKFCKFPTWLRLQPRGCSALSALS